MHPQLTAGILGDCQCGIGSTKQLHSRAGYTRRVDFEHLVLVVHIGFPLEQATRFLSAQCHINALARSHVHKTAVLTGSIVYDCPLLAIVVLVILPHNYRRIGRKVTIVCNGFACGVRDYAIDTTHSLCRDCNGNHNCK